MSSARTYDAALPLPSVFVAKMKSLNDCFNMTRKLYQIAASAGGKSSGATRCVEISRQDGGFPCSGASGGRAIPGRLGAARSASPSHSSPSHLESLFSPLKLMVLLYQETATTLLVLLPASAGTQIIPP